MRLHGLAFDEHGGLGESGPRHEHDFCLAVGGQPVSVRYTAGYFRGTDHFQFRGCGDPPEAIPFTGTPFWSHFAPSDAVQGMGGPEAYAVAYAGAGPDRDAVFHADFVGEAGKPVKGRHTARAVKPEHTPPARPTGPPSLF